MWTPTVRKFFSLKNFKFVNIKKCYTHSYGKLFLQFLFFSILKKLAEFYENGCLNFAQWSTHICLTCHYVKVTREIETKSIFLMCQCETKTLLNLYQAKFPPKHKYLLYIVLTTRSTFSAYN